MEKVERKEHIFSLISLLATLAFVKEKYADAEHFLKVEKIEILKPILILLSGLDEYMVVVDKKSYVKKSLHELELSIDDDKIFSEKKFLEIAKQYSEELTEEEKKQVLFSVMHVMFEDQNISDIEKELLVQIAHFLGLDSKYSAIYQEYKNSIFYKVETKNKFELNKNYIGLVFIIFVVMYFVMKPKDDIEVNKNPIENSTANVKYPVAEETSIEEPQINPKLEKFNKTVENTIRTKLKPLKGYLSFQLSKGFVKEKGKDGKYITELKACSKKVTDFGKRLAGTVNHEKCMKAFIQHYKDAISEKSINQQILVIDQWLVKDVYNPIISEKANIMSKDPNKYTIKSLGYNIEEIPGVEDEYLALHAQVKTSIDTIMDTIKKYDDSFGYFDNILTMANDALRGGGSSRKEYLQQITHSIQDLHQAKNLFSHKVTTIIKQEFKDKIIRDLNDMY